MTTVRHGISADAVKANVRKDLMSDALSRSNPGLCLSLHLFPFTGLGFLTEGVGQEENAQTTPRLQKACSLLLSNTMQDARYCSFELRQ